MSKIQVESGQSSSATHRITQSSRTLDRRYVRRPSNSAIEEAARSSRANRNDRSNANVTPSRLVNLRVHAADFEAARAAEAERIAREEAEAARILAETNQIALYPNVVEFGVDPANTNLNTMPASSEPVGDAANTCQVAGFNPFANNQSETVDMDSLAMNIAADYAAASLGASVKEYGDNYASYAVASESIPEAPTEQTEAPAVATLDPSANTSVDAIATAASEAIASIRVATDPDQVSEQIASLKTFAENIKANHDSPEMKELSDTIEKFVGIAMKSTKVQEETAKKSNTAVKVSLPAKANRAATKVTKSSAKIMAANRKKAAFANHTSNTIRRVEPTRMMSNPRKVANTSRRPASPEELKNRAIEQALRSVATMDEEQNRKTKARAASAMPKRRFRARHFIVAFACAAACVAGIIYVVGANIPDISVRVAAMQTGIQASYPSYIPRDYSLGDIMSENGKIALSFNGPDGASFVLSEEKSSWDSAALLRNYVEATWGDEYTTTHEQGITIYISNATSNAAWVNGGVLYKITSSSAVLTKKQVRSIVTSL